MNSLKVLLVLQAAFFLCSCGLCCAVGEDEGSPVWTLIEGERTKPWKKKFEAAAKQDRLYDEIKKVGAFSTRGPFFYRNDRKDTVLVLFYIGFAGRYEVELKLAPDLNVTNTGFRDGAKGKRHKTFRQMWDALRKDLLEEFGDLDEAEVDNSKSEKKEKAETKTKDSPENSSKSP